MTDPRRGDPNERDPALDAAWREYSVETPPPALDARILAAAHREARSRPRPVGGDDDALAEAREPSRWWWGLAAAATIGAVAFGIVQLAPPPVPGEPMTASDVPQDAAVRAAKPAAATDATREAVVATPPVSATPAAPAPPAAAAGAAPGRAAKPRSEAPPPAQANQMESERSRQQLQDGQMGKRELKLEQPAPPAPRTAPDAAPARERADIPRPLPVAPPAELQKLEADRPEPAPPKAVTAPPPGAMPTTVSPVPVPAAPRMERSNEAARSAVGAAATAIPPPAEYIGRIQALLAAGKPDEAAYVLNRFRVAYADADQRLPEELRAWAAGVPRPPQ